MDMRIPALEIKILPESNPPKSGILVRRLAVRASPAGAQVFLGDFVDRGAYSWPRAAVAAAARATHTGVSEKNTPPEKRALGKTILKSTKSGAGE